MLPGGPATEQLEQAMLAEAAGWDGVFVWEGAYGVDAWSLLSAMATRTSTIALGTMLTPLPWRRPWKVASQAATLDDLSGGRAILAVGLGWAESGIGDRRDAGHGVATADPGRPLPADPLPRPAAPPRARVRAPPDPGRAGRPAPGPADRLAGPDPARRRRVFRFGSSVHGRVRSR